MNISNLFNHFHENFGIVMTEADIFEVIEIVQSTLKKGSTKKTAPKGSFRVPELSEVRIYMESKNIIDAEKNSIKFWNFYESKGWEVGKSKMKNWKAAVATWDLPTGKNSVKPTTSSVFKNIGKNTENWMGK